MLSIIKSSVDEVFNVQGYDIYVMALFQKYKFLYSWNKTTTICGHAADSLRSEFIPHDRGAKSAENNLRITPPTMCRRTIYFHLLLIIFSVFFKNKTFLRSALQISRFLCSIFIIKYSYGIIILINDVSAFSSSMIITSMSVVLS